MELQLRHAEEVEKEKKLQKRLQLAEMGGADRKQKAEFSNQQKGNQPMEDKNNIVSKFFNRPQHQAYEIRARQDVVQKHITDKFHSGGDSKPERTIERPTSQAILSQTTPTNKDSLKTDFEAAALHRQEQRKVREREVKKAQDEQVEKKRLEQEMQKKMQAEYGLKQVKDVESYKQEQADRKKQQIERNVKHQQEVKSQIEQRSKLLQFIGSSVVQNE